MNSLKLKIPPPIVALVTVGLMWLVARATPALAFMLPAHRVIAVCVFLIALTISLSGVASFRRAGKTVNPLQPDKASSLVTTGIYRLTRNPMYLGLFLALFAWAIFLSNALAFLFLPAFVLYMNRFQISPEETALAYLFGDEFGAYKSRVRRWV